MEDLKIKDLIPYYVFFIKITIKIKLLSKIHSLH